MLILSKIMAAVEVLRQRQMDASVFTDSIKTVAGGGAVSSLSLYRQPRIIAHSTFSWNLLNGSAKKLRFLHCNSLLVTKTSTFLYHSTIRWLLFWVGWPYFLSFIFIFWSKWALQLFLLNGYLLIDGDHKPVNCIWYNIESCVCGFFFFIYFFNFFIF